MIFLIFTIVMLIIINAIFAYDEKMHSDDIIFKFIITFIIQYVCVIPIFFGIQLAYMYDYVNLKNTDFINSIISTNTNVLSYSILYTTIGMVILTLREKYL